MFPQKNCLSDGIFSKLLYGRVKQEENHGGCYRYGYDKNGNLTETSYPDGSVLNHLYYGTGHLLQSSFTRNGHKHMLAEYGRDALHREITRSQEILSEQTGFDAVGRITEKVSLAQGTSRYIRTVLNRHYQYDKVSQLVQQRTIFAEGSTQSERRERYYNYDLAGQIIGYVTDTGRERYDYDLAGNLLDGSVAAEHNQVTRNGQYLYRYDDFGRLETRSHLLTGEVQRYHYNADNQLIRVSFKNSRRYSQVTYAYDVLGRRISKTVYPVSEAVAPEITHFHWQGMQLTGEHRNEADDTPTYYFYEEGSYTPLVKLDCVATENQIYYYHAEQNGMPVMLTDAEGRVSWQQQSQTLWGTVTANHNFNTDNPVSQPLRFAGQYFDNETGLHYNTFRYYDPQAGRFTQPDPIGLAGGINLYQYAPNPLGWVDPWGWEKIRVYHYTSSEGYKGIIGSGTINMADPGTRGKGAISGKPKAVYVTTMSPEQLNLSRARGQMGLTKAKSSHYISFMIDSSKIQQIDRQDKVKRLFIQEDIKLRDTNNKMKNDIIHGKC